MAIGVPRAVAGKGPPSTDQATSRAGQFQRAARQVPQADPRGTLQEDNHRDESLSQGRSADCDRPVSLPETACGGFAPRGQALAVGGGGMSNQSPTGELAA